MPIVGICYSLALTYRPAIKWGVPDTHVVGQKPLQDHRVHVHSPEPVPLQKYIRTFFVGYYRDRMAYHKLINRDLYLKNKDQRSRRRMSAVTGNHFKFRNH